jgi:hypothetical protein
MIDREHDLAITKQVEALNISRGSVYYLPRSVPEADLAIMRRLDRLHLEFPFAGSRMLRGLLAAEGWKMDTSKNLGGRHRRLSSWRTLWNRTGNKPESSRPNKHAAFAAGEFLEVSRWFRTRSQKRPSPRPSDDETGVGLRDKFTTLGEIDSGQLRAEWLRLYRAEALRLSRDLLIRGVAQ